MFQWLLHFLGLKPRPDDWSERFNALQADVKDLTHKLVMLSGSVDVLREGFDELQTRVKLAGYRATLAFGMDDEQLRTSQAAAQLDNARAIPLLFNCLRDLKRSPQVLKEALYGIGRRSEAVSQSPKEIDLVLAVSQHDDPAVRLAALEVMAKINPGHEQFQERLWDCRFQDPDERVRAAAGEILAALDQDYEANRANFDAESLHAYAGQVVAFSRDGRTILANADDLAALEKALDEKKIAPGEVVLEYIPQEDILFGGAELR